MNLNDPTKVAYRFEIPQSTNSMRRIPDTQRLRARNIPRIPSLIHSKRFDSWFQEIPCPEHSKDSVPDPFKPVWFLVPRDSVPGTLHPWYSEIPFPEHCKDSVPDPLKTVWFLILRDSVPQGFRSWFTQNGLIPSKDPLLFPGSTPNSNCSR